MIYCHCAYAKVVPAEVKSEVLAHLSASGAAFDAVADLCEMSARKDPALNRLAGSGPVCIIACYPRAVYGLFQAAGVPLTEGQAEIHNMRTDSAASIAERVVPPAGTHGGDR